MKMYTRLLAFILLLTLCLSAIVSCTPPDSSGEGTTEGEPEPALILDATCRIIISAEANEIIQKTADMVAATIQEKAGIELAVATDAEAAIGSELVLGHTNRAESTAVVGGYAVFLNGDSLHIDASDSTTLYFAVEAVLKTWLTPDFGLAQSGALTLVHSRVNDLQGLPLRTENSVKVMTLNMRGSDDPNGNSVADRFERFQLLLRDCQPDIIGTQENSTNWMIRLERLFKKMDDSGDGDLPKYGMVGESEYGAERGGGSTNTILYRLDRFELVETDTFWLSDTPDIPSATPGVSANFMRFCTWALLKDKQTGQVILAVNTHLDHQKNDHRVKQINILMEYMADKFGEYPVVFTGDFNSTPESAPYCIVAETFQCAANSAWTDASEVDYTYHGYSDGWGMEIDFVFHDPEFTPIRYEIVSRDYDGRVSDHYPVMAEFVYD